jgi:hypothetical protein
MKNSRLIKICFALMLVTVFGGCAQKRIDLKQTRWDAVQNQEFEGVTTKQLFEAATEVFKLADGSDFTFEERKNTLIAVRTQIASILVVTGKTTYDWVLETREEGPKLKAHIGISVLYHLWKNRSGLAQWVDDGRDSQAGSVATYTLFWDRVKFILGKSTHWPTCEEMNKRFEAETNYNIKSTHPLCHFLLKNRKPAALREKKLGS